MDNGMLLWQSQATTFTHKQLEIHGCILNTVVTDALVLKHQDTSNHSAD